MGSLEKGVEDPRLSRKKIPLKPMDSFARFYMALQRAGGSLCRGERFVRHLYKGLHVVGPGLERLSASERHRICKRYLGDLLEIFGISMTCHNHLPKMDTPYLLVSNHLSWLDPIILARFFPVRLVAKSELQDWPFLGRLTSYYDPILIERGRLGAVSKTINEMETILKKGEPVGWFPEGTTGNGEMTGRFSSGLFEVSIRTGLPVLPVSIQYPSTTLSGKYPETVRQEHLTNNSVLYFGTRSFVGSLARILHAAPFPAILRVGQPLSPSGKTRFELAQDSRKAILKLLSQAPDPVLHG
ncbi:MAG: lysophospholipid acyltransferase family protein [Leptospirales bacterium]